MTTDFTPRLFERDADIRTIGAGLLACTDIDVDAEIALIIRRFNESVGGVNDDTQGYHDSITRAYVAGVRLFLAETAETDLTSRVNALLRSPVGARDWPLRFYSRDLLFSVPARRGFVPPDLAPLPAP